MISETAVLFIVCVSYFNPGRVIEKRFLYDEKNVEDQTGRTKSLVKYLMDLDSAEIYLIFR